MDIRKLQRAIVDGLEDVKAQNIAVFNTEHLSAMFERVIIASGTSNRQTKALASSVRESVKSRGMQVMSTEGEDNGEWIIVDCGAAVAHIMQPAIREYYHLEEIWGGKAVRVKMGDGKTSLPKASEPEDEAPARPARKSASAKAAPAKKAAAKRSSTRPETTKAPRGAGRAAAAADAGGVAPARKATARKPAAGTAPSRGSVPTVVVARKTPARKSSAKSSAKTAARKTIAAKAPARKSSRKA